MRRLLVLLIAALMLSLPAVAQEDGEGTTTTEATTTTTEPPPATTGPPPTSTAPTSTTPTSTSPPSTTAPPTRPLPPTTVPASPPTTQPAPTTPLPEVSDPTETVPPDTEPDPVATDTATADDPPDVTEPPTGPPVVPLAPPATATVPPEVYQEILVLRAELDLVAGRLSALEAERVRLQTLFRTNQVKTEAARAQRDQSQAVMTRRAVAAYKGTQVELLSVILGSETAETLTNRRLLMEAVFAADNEVLRTWRAAQARLEEEEESLRALNRRQDEVTREVRAESDRLRARLDDLDRLINQRIATPNERAPLPVNGFVFPVGHPHTFTDDFGDYRIGPPPHPHQGNDIFAPQGTPLFACVDGVIYVAEGGLGGRMLFITDAEGTVYFYAHLADWAPGVATGVTVRAGQVVGYVGDTGNAVGGSPHLHFEIRPAGGAPINPYPILSAAAQGALDALVVETLPPPPQLALLTATVTPLPDLPFDTDVD